MKQSLRKWFVRSVACILTLTALAKLVSASGEAKILNYPDPIFSVKYSIMLFGTAAIELCCVGLFLSKCQAFAKSWIICWLGFPFLLYRVTVVLLGEKRLCPCLGNITDRVHLAPLLVNNL